MKSLTEVMGTEHKVPTPEEMDERAKAHNESNIVNDDYSKVEENSKEDVVSHNDVDIYTKPDGDGRFLVRVGKIATLSIGTESEDFALKRVSVWSPMLDGEVFNNEEVARGRIELLEMDSVPQGVKDTLSRALSQLTATADAIYDFTH